MTANGFTDFKPVRKEEFDPVSGVPIEPEISPIITPTVEEGPQLESEPGNTEQLKDTPQQLLSQTESNQLETFSDQIMSESEGDIQLSNYPDIQPTRIETPQLPGIDTTLDSPTELPAQPIYDDRPHSLDYDDQSISRVRKPRRIGCNPIVFLKSCNFLSCGCGSFLAIFLIVASITLLYFAVPAFIGDALDEVFNPNLSLPDISNETTTKLEERLNTVTVDKSQKIPIAETKLNSLLQTQYEGTYDDIRIDLKEGKALIYIKPLEATPWITINVSGLEETDVETSSIFIGPVTADKIVIHLLEKDIVKNQSFSNKDFFETTLFQNNPQLITIDKLYFEEDNLIVITKALRD